MLQYNEEDREEQSVPFLPTGALKTTYRRSRHALARLSILRPLNWVDRHERKKRAVGPTAFLDGLRGLASLLVVLEHHSLWADPERATLSQAVGWQDEYHAATLPIIRLFFSGGSYAVALFFVISGYALSLKPLGLIRGGKTVDLTAHLASALFRRWGRLFLPILVTTFLYLTVWHVFDTEASKVSIVGPEDSYREELTRWFWNFNRFSFVYNDDEMNVYNEQLWTIPLEFRGSLLIYFAAVLLHSSKFTFRLGSYIGLIVYFWMIDAWYCGLFITGMLCCDVDLQAADDRLHQDSVVRMFKKLPTNMIYLLFITSLYLGGVPPDTMDVADLRKSTGWYFLSFLQSEDTEEDCRWFYLSWAAFFAIISVPRIPGLKAWLEQPTCQYLGRISYGLYLVHGPLLWTIGDRLYVAAGRQIDDDRISMPRWENMYPLPDFGPIGLKLNVIAPFLVILPITLWFAELVTVAIDEPLVKALRRLLARYIDRSEHT